MSNLPLELPPNHLATWEWPRRSTVTQGIADREGGIVRFGKGEGHFIAAPGNDGGRPHVKLLLRTLSIALALGVVAVGLAQTVVTIGFSMPLTGAAAKEGTE